MRLSPQFMMKLAIVLVAANTAGIIWVLIRLYLGL
jgi:hypothetical protein